MTALAGDLNLIASGFLTGGAAVFTLASAGARLVCAFFVFCFFHQFPHSAANLGATH
jgi:hypothetical protein